MTESPDPKTPCDLCSLPVGVKPCLLAMPEKTLGFCCEGCKGIYQMLNDIEDTPGPPANKPSQGESR